MTLDGGGSCSAAELVLVRVQGAPYRADVSALVGTRLEDEASFHPDIITLPLTPVRFTLLLHVQTLCLSKTRSGVKTALTACFPGFAIRPV